MAVTKVREISISRNTKTAGSSPSKNGDAETGGGAGGVRDNSGAGGTGGSGVIIISYPIA